MCGWCTQTPRQETDHERRSTRSLTAATGTPVALRYPSGCDGTSTRTCDPWPPLRYKAHKFLPDATFARRCRSPPLSAVEKRFVPARSRVAPMPTSLDWSSASSTPRSWNSANDHWFGDQVALEALVRFSDEELKHQALFRLASTRLAGEVLPDGYRFDVDPKRCRSRAVLGKSHMGGVGADAGYRAVHPAPLSTEHRARRRRLSELFKDVFLYHWKEESQHAILDELEWVRHDAGLTAEQRDRRGRRVHRPGRRSGRHPASPGQS